MNRFLLIIFFVIAFFTFADNPFADFAGTDSAVFNYVGMRMHAGLVPYKDVFDHKGFLIYFINWLGMFLGPSMIGVWLIELSMFLISSFLVCRWSEKVFNNKVAFFALFPYIALFCYCADAGNLTESYAHLFILFVLLSLFEATICRPTMRTWLFCGGCLSCILCLRPNMAVVAFLVPVYCLEELLRYRSWRSIIFACLMISLGMAVVLVPVLVYLALNGALLACLDCYWKFNVRYAAGGAWAWDCKLLFGIVLALFTIPICFETRFRRMGIYNLVFIVLTTFVLAMRAIFLHYYVILVPGTLLVFTWYLNKLEKFVCVQRFVMVRQVKLDSNLRNERSSR